MSPATNQLVAALKKALIPTSVATTVALGAVLFISHTNVHAAGAMDVTPLDDHSVAALTSLDHAMEALAANVTPSVVNIAVTAKAGSDDEDGGDEQQEGQQQQGGGIQGLPPGLQQFFGQIPGFGGGRMQPQQPQFQHGIGSGVIISPDGYIVTNDHVVNGATDVKVTLHDRRILNAHVVGVDKLTDIAVVKVNATDLPAIHWGDSGRLEPGQTVLAFGSPFGYFQFSVTRGIVSAVDRQNPYSDNARKPGGYIQTDAAINPGNSGGPLVNAHGELVGINTFIISNSGSFAGAGFAIPSTLVHSVAEQIIAHGKVDHGYLGISMNDVTPDNARFFDLKDASGAIVAQVTPDSPADHAGLKTGDVIRQLNGSKIENGSALQVAVSEDQPGTKITLDILRNGQPVSIPITVGSFSGNSNPADGDNSNSNPNGARTGKLGLAVGNITDDVRQQLQIPDSVHGAVIETVRPGSAAEDAGLSRGDIVLEVNRKPVASASQFADQIHATPPGRDILLLVWIKGNATFITLHPAGNNAGE